MKNDGQYAIAHAITPSAFPGTDETGGTVMSLTEAVMGVTAALCSIASAIERCADAMENAPDVANTVSEMTLRCQNALRDLLRLSTLSVKAVNDLYIEVYNNDPSDLHGAAFMHVESVKREYPQIRFVLHDRASVTQP